jgi:hypothetical protein
VAGNSTHLELFTHLIAIPNPTKSNQKSCQTHTKRQTLKILNPNPKKPVLAHFKNQELTLIQVENDSWFSIISKQFSFEISKKKAISIEIEMKWIEKKSSWCWKAERHCVDPNNFQFLYFCGFLIWKIALFVWKIRRKNLLFCHSILILYLEKKNPIYFIPLLFELHRNWKMLFELARVTNKSWQTGAFFIVSRMQSNPRFLRF